MNELIDRKSAKAFMIKDLRESCLMKARWIALFAALLIMGLPAVGFSQSSCAGIHINILNIRNSKGTIDCALFDSPKGFPVQFLRDATNIIVTKIRKTNARCDFLDIPPGTYALAVIHDENMDGKLNTNWLGIPTEGYGFSNNAKGLLGPPSFSAASFTYDGQDMELTISLHY